MEFLTRDVHQCPADEPLYDVMWEGRPSLLPYLLVNARLGVGLPVLVAMAVFMRGALLAWLVGGGMCLYLLMGGLLRWWSERYTLTADRAIVSRGGKRYWLGMDELMPTEFRVICSPIDRVFDCRTIVYGIKPMTSPLRGPWRNKAVFWCVKDYRKPMHLIRKAHKRYDCSAG